MSTNYASICHLLAQTKARHKIERGLLMQQVAALRRRHDDEMQPLLTDYHAALQARTGPPSPNHTLLQTYLSTNPPQDFDFPIEIARPTIHAGVAWWAAALNTLFLPHPTTPAHSRYDLRDLITENPDFDLDTYISQLTPRPS